MSAPTTASASPNLAVAVISPSRLQFLTDAAGKRTYFIERAMRSVLAQVCEQRVTITFVVGVDADAVVPEHLASRADTVFARSEGRSQAAALNAGIAAAATGYDFIAFLEDDDRWDPNYLTWAFAALSLYGFVSSTQVEVDENDAIIRIQDFPTPSGWMMPAATLAQVGPFDPASRWHLDNEWLGRLAATGIRRCHLVEVTAPNTLQTSHQVRPWLANVLRNGGAAIEIQRHGSLMPLVTRLVHCRSGMAMIAASDTAAAESKSEYDALIARYGRIPW